VGECQIDDLLERKDAAATEDAWRSSQNQGTLEAKFARKEGSNVNGGKNDDDNSDDGGDDDGDDDPSAIPMVESGMTSIEMGQSPSLSLAYSPTPSPFAVTPFVSSPFPSSPMVPVGGRRSPMASPHLSVSVSSTLKSPTSSSKGSSYAPSPSPLLQAETKSHQKSKEMEREKEKENRSIQRRRTPEEKEINPNVTRDEACQREDDTSLADVVIDVDPAKEREVLSQPKVVPISPIIMHASLEMEEEQARNEPEDKGENKNQREREHEHVSKRKDSPSRTEMVYQPLISGGIPRHSPQSSPWRPANPKVAIINWGSPLRFASPPPKPLPSSPPVPSLLPPLPTVPSSSGMERSTPTPTPTSSALLRHPTCSKVFAAWKLLASLRHYRQVEASAALQRAQGGQRHRLLQWSLNEWRRMTSLHRQGQLVAHRHQWLWRSQCWRLWSLRLEWHLRLRLWTMVAAVLLSRRIQRQSLRRWKRWHWQKGRLHWRVVIRRAWMQWRQTWHQRQQVHQGLMTWQCQQRMRLRQRLFAFMTLASRRRQQCRRRLWIQWRKTFTDRCRQALWALKWQSIARHFWLGRLFGQWQRQIAWRRSIRPWLRRRIHHSQQLRWRQWEGLVRSRIHWRQGLRRKVLHHWRKYCSRQLSLEDRRCLLQRQKQQIIWHAWWNGFVAARHARLSAHRLLLRIFQVLRRQVNVSRQLTRISDQHRLQVGLPQYVQNVFAGWRLAFVRSRQRREQLQSLRRQHLVRRIWKHWRASYIAVLVLDAGTSRGRRRLLRSHWRLWMRAWRLKDTSSRVILSRCLRLRSRTFAQWYLVWLQHSQQKLASKLAAEQWSRRQLQRCFFAWQVWHERSLLRAENAEMVQLVLRKRRLVQSWQCWIRAFRGRNLVRVCLNLMGSMVTRQYVRDAFLVWRSNFVTARKRDRVVIAITQSQQKATLRQACWSRWKFVYCRSLSRFRRRQCARICMQWRHYVQKRKELQLWCRQSLLHTTVLHRVMFDVTPTSSATALTTGVGGWWLASPNGRRCKQILSVWSAFASRRAAAHRALLLLQRARITHIFHKWALLQRRRNLEHIVTRNHRYSELRSLWEGWFAAFYASRRETTALILADSHARVLLLRRTLRGLHFYAMAIHSFRRIQSHVNRLGRIVNMRYAFGRWRKYQWRVRAARAFRGWLLWKRRSLHQQQAVSHIIESRKQLIWRKYRTVFRGIRAASAVQCSLVVVMRQYCFHRWQHKTRIAKNILEVNRRKFASLALEAACASRTRLLVRHFFQKNRQARCWAAWLQHRRHLQRMALQHHRHRAIMVWFWWWRAKARSRRQQGPGYLQRFKQTHARSRSPARSILKGPSIRPQPASPSDSCHALGGSVVPMTRPVSAPPKRSPPAIGEKASAPESGSASHQEVETLKEKEKEKEREREKASPAKKVVKIVDVGTSPLILSSSRSSPARSFQQALKHGRGAASTVGKQSAPLSSRAVARKLRLSGESPPASSSSSSMDGGHKQLVGEKDSPGIKFMLSQVHAMEERLEQREKCMSEEGVFRNLQALQPDKKKKKGSVQKVRGNRIALVDPEETGDKQQPLTPYDWASSHGMRMRGKRVTGPKPSLEFELDSSFEDQARISSEFQMDRRSESTLSFMAMDTETGGKRLHKVLADSFQSDESETATRLSGSNPSNLTVMALEALEEYNQRMQKLQQDMQHVF
jgi:hypothetical protein